MPRTTTKPDRLKQAHERLTQAAGSIVSSGDDWARMLKVASKFHRYSFNNHLMIFLQRPNATLVAGFRRWQDLGRSVRKGEKVVLPKIAVSIKSFAPRKAFLRLVSVGPGPASGLGA